MYYLFQSLLLALGVMSFSVLKADVFRSMDENGTVLFSDLAPDRVSSERVQLKPLTIADPYVSISATKKPKKSQPIAEVNRAGHAEPDNFETLAYHPDASSIHRIKPLTKHQYFVEAESSE